MCALSDKALGDVTDEASVANALADDETFSTLEDAFDVASRAVVQGEDVGTLAGWLYEALSRRNQLAAVSSARWAQAFCEEG